MLFFRQKEDPALKQAALQAEEDLFFVPYSRRDIIDMCLDQGKLAGQEKRFRQLATQLTHLIHFEFHQKIEALKSAYAPMNADFRPSPFETGEEAGHVREFYSLFSICLRKVITKPFLKKIFNVPFLKTRSLPSACRWISTVFLSITSFTVAPQSKKSVCLCLWVCAPKASPS